jgi:DNA-binding NarL/FixJ family response regulator
VAVGLSGAFWRLQCLVWRYQISSEIDPSKSLMASATVLIADDFSPWRAQVRFILQLRPEWQIIGEASDGQQAVQRAQALRPDIVLLDIGMPLLHGMAAADQIRKLSARSRVLFLTQNDDSELMNEALATGADGYVLKASAATELIPAVEHALENGHQPTLL